jgi:CheY-like chemotaxis protein
VTDAQHTHRVVVIEDDPDQREAMVRFLSAQGWTVEGARDGREALELLTPPPRPCVIFLDLTMPGMDGWRFMDALRILPTRCASSAPQPTSGSPSAWRRPPSSCASSASPAGRRLRSGTAAREAAELPEATWLPDGCGWQNAASTTLAFGSVARADVLPVRAHSEPGRYRQRTVSPPRDAPHS